MKKPFTRPCGARATAVAVLLSGGLLFACAAPSSPTATTDPQPAVEPAGNTPGPAIAEGLDALRRGDLVAAKAAYGTVLPGTPDFPSALSGLGIVALRENDIPTAVAVLEKLVEFQPHSADAWVLLGRASFRAGSLPAAETAALRAIEIDSERADARYDVALYRLEQDRLSEAIMAYERAMLVDLDASGSTRALEDLALLRQRSPGDPELAYATAFFANAVGDRQGEREALSTYVELAPAGPAASNARARLAELDGGV